MLDRTKKPAAKKEIQFNLPTLSKFTLSNGINTYLINKTDLPIVRINLLLYCGSRIDPEKLNGLANLTAMCIDEGAGGLTAIELADELETLGTHISISTDDDVIQLSMQTLKDNFKAALKLFSKVVVSPNLSETEFEKQRRKLITTLLQLKDDPDYLADISFQHIIFGKSHPYRNPTLGIKESVEKISLSDLKEFYMNCFSSVNSSIIVAGSISEPELKSYLENEFGKWNSKTKSILFNESEIKSDNKLTIINKPGSVQTEIRIGYVTGKRNQENYFQRLLLNTILGGQFSSRINLNLREKHGYTYGAHSRISYYQHSGFFQVSTSVGIENSVNALSEIFKELIEIRNGVSQTEVDFAKDTITKRFPLGFETYGQISQNIKTLLLHDLEYSYFSEYVPMITKVETEEINREAIDLIKPDEMAIVLVGDKEKIGLKELAKFNREINALEFDELLSL